MNEPSRVQMMKRTRDSLAHGFEAVLVEHDQDARDHAKQKLVVLKATRVAIHIDMQMFADDKAPTAFPRTRDARGKSPLTKKLT